MLTRSRSETCLSDLVLDRLCANELDAASSTSAKVHLDGCDACMARLAELRADVDRFASEAPSLPTVVGASPSTSRVWIGVALAAAAAVLLFVLVRPSAPDATPGVDPIESGERVKGGARLGLHLRRGDRVLEWQEGEPVHPGDALRFRYSVTRPSHLAVLSRDATDRVSVFFPQGTHAAAVAAGRDVDLPSSIVLDDVLGDEVVFAVFCDAPEPVSRLEAAIRTGELPAGCEAIRLVLPKREAP
jgi:hypothetical protein